MKIKFVIQQWNFYKLDYETVRADLYEKLIKATYKSLNIIKNDLFDTPFISRILIFSNYN